MAIKTATSFAELSQFIRDAEDGDTIIVNNTNGLVLTGELPPITKNITIRSAGNTTISGGNTYRVFRVTSGNVVFENLTIINGLAKGTDGTGASGLGGGLLIEGGNVTLINVNFRGNRAEGGKGTNGGAGAGGKGGDGLGGAIYQSGGTLRISSSSFENNATQSGAGGGGLSFGGAGVAAGGAIFLAGGSIVTEGTPGYRSNTAGGVANDTAGSVGNITNSPPPRVLSMTRGDNEITGKDSVVYDIKFDKPVTGLTVSDFSVIGVNGSSTNAIPTELTGSGDTYQLRVATGTLNGRFQVVLNDDDGVVDGANTPLGGTGLQNGNALGQPYTVDKTPPSATIARRAGTPERNAANSVVFVVNFNEPIKGLDTDASGGFSDFVVVQGPGVSGAQITAVTPINPTDPDNTAYEVTVNTGNGNGTLALQLVDRDTILKQTTDVPLGGTGLGNGDLLGPAYTIDKTSPSVAAINLLDNSPTGEATARFRVVFTQDVTGVTLDDFQAAGSGGISGTSVLSVTPIDLTSAGAARNFDVVVNTGSGDGSVGLNVLDNDSIRNDLNVALGGSGASNGNVVGPTYTVIKSAPLVASITPAGNNPTAAGVVTYTVVFNQDVTGVDRTDFRLFGTGLSNFGIGTVSGSGRTYTVTANTGSGNGTLSLNLLDNDSILNTVGAPLGGRGNGNGNFSSQPFTINKTPPRVVAINRLEGSPNNAGTVNFRVSFNEGVSQVDVSDFALSTQGVVGASIASVTRVNDSFYSVAVNTGRGDGTIRLDLLDNDSIVNNRGLTLAGAGANNGSFQGESFSLDRTAPTADMIDIAPDPRRAQVDGITIRFSEAVRGFNLADLRLTRKGSAVDLSRATLTSGDNITWTLGNLPKLTNREGDYSLLLAASGSGITDLAGNPLALNVAEQWSNQANVEVTSPGIRRRGTSGANTLRGSDNSDVLLGLGGNDTLIGLEDRDQLNGDSGRDKLNGGLDRDTLTGGAGADRFVYAGASADDALANSLAFAPDRIRDLRTPEGDRIQLDFDNNLASKNRPQALFNAQTVGGSNLEKAARNAFKDKDGVARGNQKLGAREAVFFEWRGGTYLAVNNSAADFSANQDLIINVSGMQFRPGDSNRGSLNVTSYFA
ncbi:MAG: bluetail domain-containing putative surface protein [Elainella sp.]